MEFLIAHTTLASLAIAAPAAEVTANLEARQSFPSCNDGVGALPLN